PRPWPDSPCRRYGESCRDCVHPERESASRLQADGQYRPDFPGNQTVRAAGSTVRPGRKFGGSVQHSWSGSLRLSDQTGYTTTASLWGKGKLVPTPRAEKSRAGPGWKVTDIRLPDQQ